MWIATLRPCREQHNGAIPLAATRLNQHMRASPGGNAACPLVGPRGPSYAAAGALAEWWALPAPAASRGGCTA
jgi:hypothetical protein